MAGADFEEGIHALFKEPVNRFPHTDPVLHLGGKEVGEVLILILRPGRKIVDDRNPLRAEADLFEKVLQGITRRSHPGGMEGTGYMEGHDPAPGGSGLFTCCRHRSRIPGNHDLSRTVVVRQPDAGFWLTRVNHFCISGNICLSGRISGFVGFHDFRADVFHLLLFQPDYRGHGAVNAFGCTCHSFPAEGRYFHGFLRTPDTCCLQGAVLPERKAQDIGRFLQDSFFFEGRSHP